MSKNYYAITIVLVLSLGIAVIANESAGLQINEHEYFEMQGLDVLVFQNDYTDGHQGGIEIIQHGNRVATCGNIRLSVSPGQWQPLPRIGSPKDEQNKNPNHNPESREINKAENEISINCKYPFKKRDEKGFNPIIYPDLEIDYQVKVKARGNSIIITVDLQEPIPEKWIGKVGFNLELFPGNLYGKHYYIDGNAGVFPRQPNGPTYKMEANNYNPEPLGKGKKLVVAPACEKLRMTIENMKNELILLDGALKHANGWFVVRSLIEKGITKNAVQWKITPNVIKNWKYGPIVHTSQVGYHVHQDKKAIIEMDKRYKNLKNVELIKIGDMGERETIESEKPELWGEYLKYEYAIFDFSDITQPGVYEISYGNKTTESFRIDEDIYKRHVWQPTLEYFLPVQMCHMRVNQKYRVWHGKCHMDDALMAPINIEHFDGYNNQEENSTLSPYNPLEHVPGLDQGGWHDAADYDIRIETQSDIIRVLALAYEEFDTDYDQTLIDQGEKLVEIHNPDGKADILQQIEHGVLSVLGGYRTLGRLYRGIIVPSLRQYVHLGDAATHTDNDIFANDAYRDSISALQGLWYKKFANQYSSIMEPDYNYEKQEQYIPKMDDRLVFTEKNAAHRYQGIAALAAASRVLKNYDKKLSKECLRVVEELWQKNEKLSNHYARAMKVNALTELILTTKEEKYENELVAMGGFIQDNIGWIGWNLGRVLSFIDNKKFTRKVNKSIENYSEEVEDRFSKSPFGVNHNNFMRVGLPLYYLNKHWPGYFDEEKLFAAVNYFLGLHPGEKTMSLVSGVGSNSPVVAYGFNRADWSNIPGGNVWMNIIEPNFPESKKWPYIWQEREYFTSAPVKYMFTVLAVDKILSE